MSPVFVLDVSGTHREKVPEGRMRGSLARSNAEVSSESMAHTVPRQIEQTEDQAVVGEISTEAARLNTPRLLPCVSGGEGARRADEGVTHTQRRRGILAANHCLPPGPLQQLWHLRRTASEKELS